MQAGLNFLGDVDKLARDPVVPITASGNARNAFPPTRYSLAWREGPLLSYRSFNNDASL